MSDDLRVKNVDVNEKGSVAIKVKDNNGEIAPSKKKNANLAFREMWADAFLMKRAGFEISENITVKQKQPSPYIYLRVLFMFIPLLILAFSVFFFFNGYEMYPVLIALMSLTVPSICVIFFFEMDTSGRLSITNVIFLLFTACTGMLIVKYVSSRFIYEMGGEAISYYGAMAIGLMECFIMFVLLSSFVSKLKIKDVITGILIGVIIGGGFALINNVYICFKESFVDNSYTPMIESVVYNDALIDSMVNNLKFAIPEYLMHSLSYIFIGGVLGGSFVVALNKGFKDRATISVLGVLVLASCIFFTLWIVPFTSVLFVYLLKSVMLIASTIAIVKTVRGGLANNNYI